MAADDQEWIDDYFYMHITSLNEGQAMIVEAISIEEVDLNEGALNDRKTIAGNILRFDLIINLTTDLSKVEPIGSTFLFSMCCVCPVIDSMLDTYLS